MTGNYKHHPNAGAGFTLVEILIATGLLGTVIVVATNLLFSFFSSQSQSQNVLVLESATRQMITRIVEQTVSNLVVEEKSGAVESPVASVLFLTNVAGGVTKYVFEGSNLFVCEGTVEACVGLPSTNPAAFSQMNPDDFTLTHGEFLINRVYESNAEYAHPLITIKMKLRYEQTGVESPLLQTSFTPRVYVQ